VEVHEVVAAGGEEHLWGRQYHIAAPHRRSTSPLHIAAAAVLGPDRRRHLLYFGILSGNLPVLSPSLFLSAVEVAVGTWWCNLKKLGRNLVLVYLTFLQMRSVVLPDLGIFLVKVQEHCCSVN
jgi:hypothetical protein